MSKSRFLPAAILGLAICVSAGGSVAQTGQPRPADSGPADSGPGVSGNAGSGYADIMDDVNAVFDALESEPSAESKNFVGNSAGSSAAVTSGSAERSDSAPRAPDQRAANQRGPAGPAGPATPSPVVVELFTAEGCAACPPAGDMVAGLIGRRDVLIFSWHVDYWDYLGWADQFARPDFTARQKAYNMARGARSLFTPQIVVDGESAISDMRPAHLMAAIERELAEGNHVQIARRDNGGSIELELTPQGSLPSGIAVQLIRYLPQRSVTVGAGENAGRDLSMYNIVVTNDVLARWDGKARMRLTVTLRAGKAADLPEDTRHALIVQQMQGPYPGEIFAAIPLD